MVETFLNVIKLYKVIRLGSSMMKREQKNVQHKLER